LKEQPKPRRLIENAINDCLGRRHKPIEMKYFLKKIEEEKIQINDISDFVRTRLKDIKSIPIDVTKDSLSTCDWMSKSWNIRAEKGLESMLWNFHQRTPKQYGLRGHKLALEILGKGKPVYDMIVTKNPKQMRILEIGCGMGRILFPFAKIFGEVIGVDISKEMIHLGKKYSENLPNCQMIVNNGDNLSMFSDNYFDFIYSNNVFQHIPDKKVVRNYISEASRVIKNGSVFKFNVYATKNETSEMTDSTYSGVRFTSSEIHKIASKNKFRVIEEFKKTIPNEMTKYTFQSIKLSLILKILNSFNNMIKWRINPFT